MDDTKIVLDKKAFGALAVDSRVNILKALRERRKMLTELSDELKLSASSVKEHLDTLLEAGLIERFDEGHKWKYYALTRKGEEIVTPNREIRVWVVLGMSAIGLLISSLLMFSALPMTDSSGDNGALLNEKAVLTAAPAAFAQGAGNFSVEADIVPARGVEPPEQQQPGGSPYLVIAAFCSLVMVGCVVYLAISRMDNTG